MKKIITALFTVLSVFSYAQVKVNDIVVKRNGGNAEILFRATVDKNAVKSNYKLTLVPIIHNGTNTAELSPIIVRGKRREIMDTRNKVKNVGDAIPTQNGQTINYRANTPYADWLQGASIRFDVRSEGCCSKETLEPYLIAQSITVLPDDRLIAEQTDKNGTSTQTNQETQSQTVKLMTGGMILIVERNPILPEKARLLLEKAIAGNSTETLKTNIDMQNIDFNAGSSQLNTDVYNNRKNMNAIVTSLRTSEELTGKIDITGYASPEGMEHLNNALAERRAVAIRDYILKNVPKLKTSDFNIINGGENWEGLRRLVEKSDMLERWQILDIIDRTPAKIDYANNTSRKKQLMDMDGGRPWRYMYVHFFPELRNAGSVIVYKKSDKANSVAIDAQNVETINRAIDMISARKASEALQLLYKVENDPRSWNPLGVCFILLENKAKAVEYLQKAADAGFNEAKENLQQIK